ncbi:hypothetical protein HWV00_20905 (plasmid) [Moritella sp. 24]|uniref:hypothetical protein n=1 Tax=Moritella sp. 24 TaxID=2746230 RepID=UPI001BAB7248|nr:hypothetical protein [Moritella sp. 24]QUM78734.1 hypothetical protein HWV00_20905 [Moritella sp. 24]
MELVDKVWSEVLENEGSKEKLLELVKANPQVIYLWKQYDPIDKKAYFDIKIIECLDGDIRDDSEDLISHYQPVSVEGTPTEIETLADELGVSPMDWGNEPFQNQK